MKDVTPHTACRVCDHTPLREYLSLGEQPLANGLLLESELGAPEFTVPLAIALCPNCGLSQLTTVVDPDRLYKGYAFRSGVSEHWHQHCERLAQEYTKEHTGQAFVLDIGANDGTLLDAFDRHGHTVLGVDPAPYPSVRGVSILPLYWNAETATTVADRHGLADLILATNVIGHVDDVRSFLSGIATALGRYGTAIIEAPHIMPLLYMNAFDTIYHEHLSYWSLAPLREAAKRAGLFVYDCKPQAVHGGTMRYYLCHERMAHLTDNLAGLWKREQECELTSFEPYQEFAGRVRNLRNKLTAAFKRDGMVGWGASAKGNVLMNYVGVDLPAIYDETPAKQGRYTPGRHIRIEPLPPNLADTKALALLSWNWARELKTKARLRGFAGSFLTPIPEPSWEAA